MENAIREAAARRRERANQVREEAERDRAEFEADELIRRAADTLRQYGPGTCCYSDALWPEWDFLSGDPIPDVYWQKKAELLHAVVLAVKQSVQHAERLASLEPIGDEDRDLAVALYRTAEHGDVRQTAAALRELQADENGVFLPAEPDGSSPNEPVNRWLACGLPDEIRDIPHAGSRAATGSDDSPAGFTGRQDSAEPPKWQVLGFDSDEDRMRSLCDIVRSTNRVAMIEFLWNRQRSVAFSTLAGAPGCFRESTSNDKSVLKALKRLRESLEEHYERHQVDIEIQEKHCRVRLIK